MPDVNFKIEPDQIIAMFKEVLMNHLTDGKRDELIKETFNNLLKGNWQEPSQMNRAFGEAAQLALRDIVREEMLKEENREKLRAVFLKAWENMFDEHVQEKLINTLSDKMRQALTGERY